MNITVSIQYACFRMLEQFQFKAPKDAPQVYIMNHRANSKVKTNLSLNHLLLRIPCLERLADDNCTLFSNMILMLVLIKGDVTL